MVGYLVIRRMRAQSVKRVTGDVFLTLHCAIISNLQMTLCRFMMAPDAVFEGNEYSSRDSGYSGAYSGE